jgi:hypothetical protein
MNPESAALLEKLLTMVAEEGEDAAFSYCRNVILKEKDSY